MGPVAARILKQVKKGKVIAVFDNCFYLDLDNTYICLGNSNFSDGPLNVISSAPDKTNWITSGIRVGDRANVANHILSVGLNMLFRFANTEVWKPRPVLITPTLTSKIEQFYASNPSQSGLPKQAYPLIDALSDWRDHGSYVYTGELGELDFERAFGMTAQQLGDKVIAFSKRLVD